MSDPNRSDRVHILIVDDEPDIRELIREGLKTAGYECFSAGDGYEGLKVLEEKPIDVVISDITMPRMNGIEFARRIRESYDADVILVTGYIETYSYDQAMELGVSDFLQKPIGLNELMLRLRRVLRERSNIKERDRAETELRQSLEKLRTVMESVVETMALVIEKRDPYTSGHQKRVALLAEAIAEEMGLPQEQIQGIRLAGMIHDIGKIAVPAEILSKPGVLTDLEIRMIREHSQIGHDVLEKIDFPWPVAEMVLQHHERIDGSGYPRGLLGSDICLEAKILAVADVFEAMVSHRPYRQALGFEAAIGEITRNRGILYDPGAVDACAAVVTRDQFKLK